MKKNYKDMLLESESGFMMPFPLEDQEELQISLGYGEQQHPEDGTPFNHQGVDLLTNGKPLYAMASGMIIGAGHDSIHEDYIIAKYGNMRSSMVISWKLIVLMEPSSRQDRKSARAVPSYIWKSDSMEQPLILWNSFP